MPTFGTNTNNHLESFNNNIKISVNHHLHLSASIEEILAITFTFLTKQPLKDARDWKIRKNLLVKERSINSLINTIDDFGAKHIIKEYNLIENQYKFEWINGGLNKLKKDFINLILFYF